MSALAAGSMPKADMSVRPPGQDIVRSGDIARFRMNRAATLENPGAAKARSPLADDFSITPDAIAKANSGLGQMSGEKSAASADQKMPWEVPGSGDQIVATGSQKAPTMNAFAATMPDMMPKVDAVKPTAIQPSYVGNGARSVSVDASVEQESAAMSFFNNSGDTSNRTAIGTVNRNAQSASAAANANAISDEPTALDPKALMSKVQERREATAAAGVTAKTPDTPAMTQKQAPQPARMAM
tara:strand:+ start:427 stop:1149 length:723 start_codon:yes stop_codon:yes gene_type:complete